MEAIRTTTAGPFDAAVERVKSAFKDQGFGTLSEIDVQKTLKEKIGEEIERYTILGVCNPHLALRAIAAEHEVGVYMPCVVLVHECGGKINVAAQNPMQIAALAENEALIPIVEEARERIAAAVSRI